jgi:hypothetical protein
MEITIQTKGKVVTLVIPDEETKTPAHRAEAHGRASRYSESKRKRIFLDDMHPCHLLNAVRKDMEGMTPNEILNSPYFREAFALLGEAVLLA